MAKDSGYSKRQVIDIARSKAFKSHLEKLQSIADAHATGFLTIVGPEALEAVKMLTGMVTPGTKLFEES